jgi:serine/threonine protein kinase
MEFIEGETLDTYLNHARGGVLPIEEVLRIGEQLCTVLAYLHGRQPPIIFRDVKPTNVMLTPDGHLYLIDFGIARLFKPGQAQDTVFFGSPGYAAPEQYGKAPTTARSQGLIPL